MDQGYDHNYMELLLSNNFISSKCIISASF